MTDRPTGVRSFPLRAIARVRSSPLRARSPAWAAVLVVAIAYACACGHPAPSARPARVETRTATLRAGTSGDYPPLSEWRGRRPDGFAPALLDAFASAEHVEVAWVHFRWPELVADLRADAFDVAADGITVRPERSIAGRFTVPIARGGAVLLLRRPAWAPAASDARGRAAARAAVQAIDRPALRVVVNRGGHLERVARDAFARADVRAIADNAAVRDAFARGAADAAMTNTFEAPRWAAGLDGVERVGPLTNDVTALWVRADRADLAARLDAWLLDEAARGVLAARRGRMLGDAGDTRAPPAVDALLAATAERLALMPYVAAAKRRAGRPIEDRAQEERVIAAGVAAVDAAARTEGRAPPPRARVEAFLRAEIEAAKVVQERDRTTDASFSLDEELRPAIARITARMAFLAVRVPRGATAADARARAEDDLFDAELDAERVEQLVRAIVGLGEANER